MSKMNSFVKSFVAIIKGDDAEVKAQKAYRQAVSGLKSQINSLEGDTVNYEDKLQDALETQLSSRVNNGQKIENRDQYVKNLISAKNRVTEAEEALESHKAKVNFLKDELASLEKDA
jgi:chromosome segregation ATPase